jgi:hypothetical protein
MSDLDSVKTMNGHDRVNSEIVDFNSTAQTTKHSIEMHKIGSPKKYKRVNRPNSDIQSQAISN